MFQLGDNASEIAKQIGRRLMELITAAGHGLYRISYLTGIRTVRIVRYMGRRIVHVLTPVGRVLYKGLDWLVLRHGRNIGHEFVRVGQGFRIAGRQLKAAFRRHPLLTVPQLLTMPFKALRRHGRALISVLNLAAPVAAAFVLAGTVQYWSNLTFALSLEYDGQQVGYISSEAVFDTAATMAVERVINTDNSFEVQRIPKMTLAVVEKSDILNETEVCDQILKSSSGSIRQASGLYIDGRFEGSMNSREELDGLLNGILSEYTDGSSGERAEFIQNVDIIDGLYPVSSVVAAEAMDQKLSASMVVERHYTVEAGDTPIGIAAKNSMTLEELRSLNANLDDLMLAGKEVLVQRAQPYLRVQVVRTIEYTEPIAYSTEKVEDTTQYLGYEKERNGGQNGERKITAEVTLVDGIEQSRSILATETISEPVNRVVVVGAKKMNANANIGDGVSTGKFVWPLPSCRRISSDYGNRGSFHAGIDISGNGVYGKDIIAADGGTVVEVNSTNWWGQGYGYYVMIDHGGGYVTRYAHCSSILVTKGQKVTQGQLIAKAGDSGNSQGAHLHFEIRVNGKAVDPKPYLY